MPGRAYQRCPALLVEVGGLAVPAHVRLAEILGLAVGVEHQQRQAGDGLEGALGILATLGQVGGSNRMMVSG